MMIEARNLLKVFEVKRPLKRGPRYAFSGPIVKFKAVDNVSFGVEKGETLTLLGPNGSGKTTIIKMLCGLLEPTQGEIYIDGGDLRKNLHRTGVMLTYSMIYYRLTGYENLRYFARLYEVENFERRIGQICDFLNIDSWLNEYVEHYSSGMKVKLALARALIHDPQILYLDEPTLGLDPHIANEVRNYIKRLDKTVLISTHYMEEAEKLSDRIGFLNEGGLAGIGTAEELKTMVKDKPHPELFDVFMHLIGKTNEPK